jgi:flagellar motor switch protein FliG
MTPPPPEKPLTGPQKAAIILVLLGDEVSTAVYQKLSQQDLQAVTQQIASLGNVAPEAAVEVLQEYNRLSMTQDYLVEGGPAVAANLLSKAFGEDFSEKLLSRIMEAGDNMSPSFENLQKTDSQTLAKFVQGEHPQTIAMILAQLGGKTAASLLVLLPEKVRGQTVKRLAEMQQFSPEMADKISGVLNRKVRSLGEQSRRAYGGVKNAAELLNRIDPGVTKSILEGVEAEDARLALTIRNNMFTFADLLGVPEIGIRDLLSAVDKKNLATALKGAHEDLKNHIFKTMSSRAVEMLKEDMESLGPVRAQAVVLAQQEIVQAARGLEAQGKLVLNNEAEEAMIV